MARHNSMIPDVLWDTFGSEFNRLESDGPRPWQGEYAAGATYGEGVVVGTRTTGIDGADCGNALWVATSNVPSFIDVDPDNPGLFDPCLESIRLDVPNATVPHWAFYAGRPIDLYGFGNPADDTFLSLAVCAGGSTFVNASTGTTWTTPGDGTWALVGTGGGGGGGTTIAGDNANVAHRYLGDYDGSGTSYLTGDVVTDAGATFLALSDLPAPAGDAPSGSADWVATDKALILWDYAGIDLVGTGLALPAGSVYLFRAAVDPADGGSTMFVKFGTGDTEWVAVKLSPPNESYAVKASFLALSLSSDPELFPGSVNGTTFTYRIDEGWALGWIMHDTVDGEIWWINASIRIVMDADTDSGGTLVVDLAVLLAAFGCIAWEGSQDTPIGTWGSYGGGGNAQHGFLGKSVSVDTVVNGVTFGNPGTGLVDPVKGGGTLWLNIAAAASTF